MLWTQKSSAKCNLSSGISSLNVFIHSVLDPSSSAEKCYTLRVCFFIFLKIQNGKKTRSMTFEDERFSIERTESEKELVFIK